MLKGKINATTFFSKEDCRQIVVKFLNRNDFVVKKFDIKRVNNENVVGFLGDYFHLVIKCKMPCSSPRNVTRRLQFFVKTVPLEDEEKRAKVYKLFKKEHLIYAQLFAQFENETSWRPRCCLASDDYLVLEDISERGYRSQAYGTTFDRPHVECVLRTLAKMHSHAIASELCGFDIRKNAKYLLVEEYSTAESANFRAEMKATKFVILQRDEFRQYHKSVQENFDQTIRKTFDCLETSKKYRNTLCHMDLWSSNIMFNYLKGCEGGGGSPQNAILLDFQLSRYLPPAADVLICIFMNTRRRDRALHMEQYLKYYWNYFQLQLNGMDLNATEILPWNEFRECCNDYEFLAIIYNCRYTPLSNLKPGTLQRMSADKLKRICLDERGQFILDTLPTETAFCEAVIDAYKDLVEKHFYEGTK